MYNIKTHVYVVHLGAVHDMPCPKVVQHFLHLFGFVNSGETFFDRPHNSQRMLSELWAMSKIVLRQAFEWHEHVLDIWVRFKQSLKELWFYT